LLFSQAIAKINPELNDADIGRLLDEVKLTLDSDGLGQAFYDCPAYGKLVFSYFREEEIVNLTVTQAAD
jgi:hypothetical protein